MNISGVSTVGVSSLISTQNVHPSGQPDADGDGDSHKMHRGHRHGGGAMGKAVMEALQSLGVSMPAPPQPGQGPSPDGGAPRRPTRTADKMALHPP